MSHDGQEAVPQQCCVSGPPSPEKSPRIMPAPMAASRIEDAWAAVDAAVIASEGDAGLDCEAAEIWGCDASSDSDETVISRLVRSCTPTNPNCCMLGAAQDEPRDITACCA
jgi:hypothetical protein